MLASYGKRYLPLSLFISLCGDLNVKTDERELEYYERTGVMLPTARVIEPDAYVQRQHEWQMAPNAEVSFDEWPEMASLIEHLCDDAITDDQLIHCFDREFGRNPYLARPAPDTYQPWDSYRAVVAQMDGQELSRPTAEHYYSYWQVHQLYWLQQWPDLYQNAYLLANLCEQCKALVPRKPRAASQDRYVTFDGKASAFDALSFYSTAHDRETQRTFAPIPEEHRVKTLPDEQHRVYQERLSAHAQLTLQRYGLSAAGLYDFLAFLVGKRREYQGAERLKLADALGEEISSMATFIWATTGQQWEEIGEELGKRSFWVKQAFRHVSDTLRARDNARSFLDYFYKKHLALLQSLSIQESDVAAILEFCEQNDLDLLVFTLDDCIATSDEERKFQRVTRYVTLKNLTTSLEYFLKALANQAVARGRDDLADCQAEKLFSLVRMVMRDERPWIGILESGTYSTRADPARFRDNLHAIQSEPSEYARIFLLACLARNLTVHSYPTDDWFYGDLFGEMLDATLRALFYSWHVAKREAWVLVS